jgi:hypothetical protein
MTRLYKPILLPFMLFVTLLFATLLLANLFSPTLPTALAAGDFPPEVFKTFVQSCQQNCQTTFENSLKTKFPESLLNRKRPSYQPSLLQYCAKSCHCTFNTLSQKISFKEYSQFEKQLVTPGATPNPTVNNAILECSKGCAEQHSLELQTVKSKLQP